MTGHHLFDEVLIEMKFYELLNNVHDRASFFAFVRALIADRQRSEEMERQSPSDPYGHDAGGWENVTISDFLESALAWAEDTGMGVSQGLSESPSWKEFATFLYLGKIYE